MKLVSLIVFLFVSFTMFAQLPNKVAKLEGEWQYKEGSGFEVWTLKDDILHGYAYRINKVGDTSMVEDIQLKRVNKTLVYSLETYNHVGDSIVTVKNDFVGLKRKMSFMNIDSNTPYSISYSYGFLNRKKLKIKIKYGIKEDPVVLKLVKVKA